MLNMIDECFKRIEDFTAELFPYSSVVLGLLYVVEKAAVPLIVSTLGVLCFENNTLEYNITMKKKSAVCRQVEIGGKVEHIKTAAVL